MCWPSALQPRPPRRHSRSQKNGVLLGGATGKAQSPSSSSKGDSASSASSASGPSCSTPSSSLFSLRCSQASASSTGSGRRAAPSCLGSAALLFVKALITPFAGSTASLPSPVEVSPLAVSLEASLEVLSASSPTSVSACSWRPSAMSWRRYRASGWSGSSHWRYMGGHSLGRWGPCLWGVYSSHTAGARQSTVASRSVLPWG
mmetsp:Transcript_61727/g.147176  ORF Transcript_61727/g.147176 Transcript_61727/m.147176 type:complete len:203 (-) Transcript_61727:595-1203(-)